MTSYAERSHEVEGQVHGSLARACGISPAAEDGVRDGGGKDWLPYSLSLTPDLFLFPLRLNLSQMVALSMALLRQTVILK